jgi:O-acetyl-ADP-ribose deacetylase (regulator of RNase III)
MVRSQLLNSMSVETPYGFRTFNLHHGNICNSQDNLLVVSSHANPLLSPGGSVIEAITQRYGMLFTELKPLIVLEGVFGTHYLETACGSPHQRILVVRVPASGVAHGRGTNDLAVYETAVWSLFGSVAALELRGEFFQSMALPLLGGQRGYPIREAMAIILRYASQWLRVSHSMRVVNFYIFDEAHVKDWEEAMNAVLGRRFIDTARNNVIRALRDEILSVLGGTSSLRHAKLRDAIVPLEHGLVADPLCLQQIAIFGRALAERIVQCVCSHQKLDCKGPLIADIELLRKHDVVAPWIISHLHSLRIFGNETVHAKSVRKK